MTQPVLKSLVVDRETIKRFLVSHGFVLPEGDDADFPTEFYVAIESLLILNHLEIRKKELDATKLCNQPDKFREAAEYGVPDAGERFRIASNGQMLMVEGGKFYAPISPPTE